jgi:hypothetical protein
MAGSATFVGLGASDGSVASDLFARREAEGSLPPTPTAMMIYGAPATS